MIIALARTIREAGFHEQQALHVTAVDVNIRAVHMAYVQLSLLHIQTIIVHGNSITLEEWSHWHTPARVLGGWQYGIAADKAIRILTDTTAEGLDAPRGKGQLELAMARVLGISSRTSPAYTPKTSLRVSRRRS